MKILIITSSRDPLPSNLMRQLECKGIEVSIQENSPFSAFTSMTIARATKTQGFDFVLVSSIPDAAAAVSALKISRNPYKIICAPNPNSKIPTGIAHDVRQKVNGWIFASEEQEKGFPSDLNNKKIIPRVELDTECPPYPTPSTPLTFAWIGPIDDNRTRLIEVIESIGNSSSQCQLIICGTAKAQNVMPAVHRSRAVPHPEKIIWTGENFDLPEIVSKAHALIQSGIDPSPIETAMCQNRRRLILANETSPYLDAFAKEPNSENSIGQTFDTSEILNQFASFCHEIL